MTVLEIAERYVGGTVIVKYKMEIRVVKQVN